MDIFSAHPQFLIIQGKLRTFVWACVKKLKSHWVSGWYRRSIKLICFTLYVNPFQIFFLSTLPSKICKIKKDITAIANKNFHWRICFNLSSCKFVTNCPGDCRCRGNSTVLSWLLSFYSPPHFLHPNFILNAAEFRQVKNAIDMYE